jgi:transposase
MDQRAIPFIQLGREAAVKAFERWLQKQTKRSISGMPCLAYSSTSLV